MVRSLLDGLYARPHVLLTLTMFMWACNAIAGQFARGEITPVQHVLIRWTMVTALMWPLFGRQALGFLPTMRQHAWKIAAMAMLGFTGFNILFYVASFNTTAVNVGILQGSIPMIVAAMAFLIRGSRITLLQGGRHPDHAGRRRHGRDAWVALAGAWNRTELRRRDDAVGMSQLLDLRGSAAGTTGDAGRGLLHADGADRHADCDPARPVGDDDGRCCLADARGLGDHRLRGPVPRHHRAALLRACGRPDRAVAVWRLQQPWSRSSPRVSRSSSWARRSPGITAPPWCWCWAASRWCN